MERATVISALSTRISLLRTALTPERLLRWSLGIVYLWFGGLKLVSMSPVVELVRHTYPPLAMVPLYCGLTLFEVALGVVFLVGVWRQEAAAAAVLHLIGTFSVLFMSPRTAFLPQFPFLTMEGEFVVKNLVLLAAAGSLWLGVREASEAASVRLRPWMLVAVLAVAAGLGLAGTWMHQAYRTAAERSASPAVTQIRMTADSIDALTGTGTEHAIVVQGAVIDRCHLVGCWLELHDRTGELFVDLAPAGLNARGIPIGSRVQVTGHIGKTREGDVGFVASSIQTLAHESQTHQKAMENQPAVAD